MVMRINTHGQEVPAKNNGDWYDLCASETVVLKQGEVKVIPLGISVELPEGYTAYVLPRSSTPDRHGIIMANNMGVIDQVYNGDDDVIGFVALAIRDTVIEAGTRIAQLAVYKSPEKIDWLPVQSLGNKNRGGFGSTGVK